VEDTESHVAVKSLYEAINSIHTYSLSAHRLPDLQTLSDKTRHLYDTYFVKEDPLVHNATYGVILNKNVRRRTGRGPPPPPAESTPTIKPVSTAKTTSKSADKSALPAQLSGKTEENSRPSSAGSTTPTSATAKQPSLKRDTSDIFKSFSKAKNASARPTPKAGRNGTDLSVGNTSASGAEGKGTMLANTSEDEGESEEEALFLDTNTRAPAKKRASTRKTEREAKLRKMMDDSDEEMEEAELIDPEEAGLDKGDQAMTDGKSEEAAIKQVTGEAGDGEEAAEGVNWSDSDADNQPKKEQAAEPDPGPDTAPAAPPRRRRGKRKVLKKKTMKDEEGYLVTREEPAWESFSEDEPAPPKAKANPTVPRMQTQSQGKGAAKGELAEKGMRKGGGNIMSFFGKK
jgi:DNA polymerase delta subunit 3